jgi:hypothetical protein
MPEFGGLKIEPRCVRCSRLPTADTVLFEMQNHRYICNTCKQSSEQEGKHIAWASGLQIDDSAQPAAPLSPQQSIQTLARPTQALTRPTQTLPSAEPLRVTAQVRNLPPDSLFAVLEIPLDTSISKLREILRQQMKTWATRTSDPAYKQMIVRLREWKLQLEDEITFEEEREKLKVLVQGNAGVLSVGGRSVFTAQEFRNVCEELSDGWNDGVRYLRTGELWQWILFQLEDRNLSKEAQTYQKWTSVSDFRALNEMLYCLDPERPFRFYEQDSWQSVQNIPSAKTSVELAQLCDANWKTAERHLYAGSIVLWLERTQHIDGLREYYNRAVAGYETDNYARDRGLGLELLLEHTVPELEKPDLVASFDGQVGGYTLKAWDREIAHEAITLTVTNTTRGYVSAVLEMQGRNNATEPDWVKFPTRLVTGTPASREIAREQIALQNLSSLKRGHTYKRQLLLSLRQEFGRPPKSQPFPMVIKPMRRYQGLRGKLWAFGLRGGFFGLLWHFVSAALLAALALLLTQKLIPSTYLDLPDPGATITVSAIFQQIGGGLLFVMQFLQNTFILITAGIAGFAGFWAGMNKGHTDYTAQQGARVVRRWGCWLALIFAFILLFWDQAVTTLSQGDYYSQNIQILNIVFFLGASLSIWLMVFLIVLVLAAIRPVLERFLRARYASLLNPPGRA